MALEMNFCVAASPHDPGQEQSGDGGQGHAHAGPPGQPRSAVAQVGVAARLGHGVNGGIVVAGGEVNVDGLVAFGLCQAALLDDVHKARCRGTSTGHAAVNAAHDPTDVCISDHAVRYLPPRPH